MEKTFRKTGIDIIGDAPWGTHLCQFYETREDLVDILVPYFKAGLENNEFCMWITSEPLKAEDAKAALKKVLKNLDHFIEKGQIEILDYSEWYTKSGKFDANNVLQGWVEKENQALKRGYDGLRLSGNTFWLGKRDWRNFTDYEEEINNVIGKYRMIAICTYPLGQWGVSEVIDVVSNHQFALIRREGQWVIIESSERKRAEETLQKSEKRFHTSVETLIEGFTILSPVRDGDGHIIDFIFEYINEAGCKMNHKTREEHMGRTLLELFPKQRETGLFDDCAKVVNTGQPVSKEYVLYEPLYGGGKRLKQALNYHVTRFEDGLLGTWQDTTERKRGEEVLKHSEERLKRLIENSHDVITMTDLEGRILYYSGPPEFGVASEDLLGKNPFDILEPVVAARLMSQLKHVVREKEASTIENLIPWKKESFWFSIHMYPTKDEKGQMVAVGIIVRNITERKQAEEALRKSERELETIFDTAPILMFVVDRNYRVRKANRAAEALVGTTEAELYGLPCGDVLRCLHRLDSTDGCCHGPTCETCTLRQAVQSTLETNRGVSGAEADFEMETKGQTRRHSFSLATNSLKIGDEAMVLVCLEDITERKQVEEALRVSLQKYRVLFESFPLGITISDKSGKIMEANRQSEQLLGITREEHPQRTIDGKEWQIIRKDGTAMPADEYASTRALRENRLIENVEMGIVKDQGEITWISVTAAPIPLEGYGVAIAYGDITERKRVEEELKSSSEELRALAERLHSAREEERTQVARQIHDELGQALTALKMDLSWLNKKLPRDQDPLHEKARSMSQLLDATVQMVKRISTELRPGLLDDLGLAAAIEWQAEEFQNRTGIKCALTITPEEVVLEANLSTALFRIFQETLTNVGRHAKATRVKVSLKQKAAKLEMKVEDNGKGITEKQISSPKSLGLIGMRERVYPWQGELKITSTPRKGTTVTVTVPIKKG